ncbi:MAG: methyl-accepting chemotaxis protein, partial [Burkholderiales bacterium]|nr:methyl-accepting chemotaxis protein [Burkholderiales bacterium]
MKLRLLRFDSISKKLLVPTLLLVTVLLSALGGAMIAQQNRVLRSMMESKADSLATMLGKISAPYVTNYDLSALENFVKEATNDRDVAFAEFYDASAKSLAGNLMKAPADQSALIIYERDIIEPDGKAIGKVKVGYKTTVLHEALRTSVTIVITSVLVVLMLLALGLTLIVRAIARPAAKILEGFTLLAQGEGDLTARIEVKTNDELGQMVAAFNKTMEKLHALISQIRDMAGSISIGAKQIASGNADLSQRTEEQASSLEETASSM